MNTYPENPPEDLICKCGRHLPCRHCEPNGDGLGAPTCSAWMAINAEAKDGQERILTDGSYVLVGEWVQRPHDIDWPENYCWMRGHMIMRPQPTMWIPLPDPPKQNDQAQQRGASD